MGVVTILDLHVNHSRVLDESDHAYYLAGSTYMQPYFVHICKSQGKDISENTTWNFFVDSMDYASLEVKKDPQCWYV